MEDIKSPNLSPLTSLTNTPRLLSPEPRFKHEGIASEAAPDFNPLRRPHLHHRVLTLSHLRLRRLRHHLPRDIVSISKLCRDLQERVNDIPVPIIPAVPSIPHLRSAGPVNVYEEATSAAAADVERIADIKTQLELLAHELEILRGAVFERFEDLFDKKREEVLKKQLDCCFSDLKELQVEVNHRIWTGRLRQPLQPLAQRLHQLGMPTMARVNGKGKGKCKEKETEKEGEREGEQNAQEQSVLDAMPMRTAMDMDLSMGAQFQFPEWPEFNDEEIMTMFKEMEEELLEEPVNWEEILKAEATNEEAQVRGPVKREQEDDEMQLDDVEETETVKGDQTKKEVDEEKMEEDVDTKEPEESIWSEESGGVDWRAYLPSAHPCDPGARTSWHCAWGRRQ
ncbi:hypothetical protein NEUTE1DRAFT_100893 [Neurospora tetrasperma FGSC 2508]|uniref:Uncharacterized protein n=1 Tax=Neurospora tetrasperma (strain FGSC 2508 / ATCC MYA-4615 / P0657) TaxID=510951 RepID=F8MMZ4_NEUT8|nr:uncharacterized protein NEUTE1DRAFT_100893 [Neurospora tetrasperma FGSC 2508]EGO58018.1 hypothetical protein NEUTE1DRAFT_100893 [Neurospora tetrasperma FGSC 2508]EGZ71676.1 hypothetical protein NEUTE2DRAFT_138839 [Neurospora tetrasperma FGSC 2509]